MLSLKQISIISTIYLYDDIRYCNSLQYILCHKKRERERERERERANKQLFEASIESKNQTKGFKLNIKQQTNYQTSNGPTIRPSVNIKKNRTTKNDQKSFRHSWPQQLSMGNTEFNWYNNNDIVCNACNTAFVNHEFILSIETKCHLCNLCGDNVDRFDFCGIHERSNNCIIPKLLL